MRDLANDPRRAAAGVLLAAVLALAPLTVRAENPPVLPPFDPHAALATDPGVERRTLANGLEIVVDQHPNPPGQIAIRVLVGAGSLAEDDDQVGAAYLAPRVLLARARATPAGERLGQHPGAFDPPPGASSPVGNSAEHAWLALNAPASNAQDLAASLRFVAEFLSAESLDAGTVATVRPQVQEEARRTESKSDRLRRAVLPALTPDSLLARRLAFPAVDDLCETGSDPVVRFVRERYTPMNSTVIVVGDVEPAKVFALAAHELGRIAAGAAVPMPRPGISPRPRGGVVVASDAESISLIAELIVTTPAAGPARTAANARAALATELARTALERRLTAALDECDTGIKEVNAWAGDVPGPMCIGVATASGDPARWREVTARVVGAARGIAQQGISAGELDVLRREHLARLEEAARTAPGAPSSDRAKELARAEATGAVVQSAQQALETALRLLPLVSAEEVSRAAADRFDPSLGTLLLVFPADFPAPSEAEARKAMHPTAVSEKPPGPRTIAARVNERDDAQRALPGGVEELTVNAGAGVTSAWLTNGLRVHYRETPDAGGQVSFAISLVGGRAQEDQSTRGLTLSTQALWSNPATRTTTAAQMRELMSAIPLRLHYLIETDRVLIEFTVAGEHAEDALALIAGLIEAPLVDAEAFDRWKWGEQQRIEMLTKSPMGVLGTALERAVFPPDDPRIGSLSNIEVQAITLKQSQAWAEHLCGGPIEIGVSGDLRASLALETVARTLGRLTPRPRPTPGELRHAGRLLHPVGDIDARIEFGRQTDAAGVLVSIAGADDRDPGEFAHMAMQARVLQNAITQRTTVDRSLATRVFVTHAPGSGIEGSGLLNIRALTEPGLVDLLIKEIDTQIDRVASDGITAGELADARASSLEEIDRALTDPRYWARELSDRTFRDLSLDDPQKLRQAIESATAADLSATLQRLDALGERVRLRAVPATTPR